MSFSRSRPNSPVLSQPPYTLPSTKNHAVSGNRSRPAAGHPRDAKPVQTLSGTRPDPTVVEVGAGPTGEARGGVFRVLAQPAEGLSKGSFKPFVSRGDTCCGYRLNLLNRCMMADGFIDEVDGSTVSMSSGACVGVGGEGLGRFGCFHHAPRRGLLPIFREHRLNLQ